MSVGHEYRETYGQICKFALITQSFRNTVFSDRAIDGDHKKAILLLM